MKQRLIAVWAACLFLFAGCTAGEAASTRSFAALDTVCRATLYGGDGTLLDRAVAEVAAWETLWSRTAEDGDVRRLNTADGEAVTVSADTAALLEEAVYWSQVTNGALDVTVGGLKTLWDTATSVPTDDMLQEARTHVGMDKLHGDPWRLTDGAQLDLGAIAKGAIADRLTALFEGSGCTGALLDLGGNVTVWGQKPDGRPFRVAVADPRDPSNTVLTVEASNVTLATSGSYQRYYELDGNRYSHILDPATGRPVDNDLQSVTVIAASATAADALSTACFVMGYDRARTLIESLDGVEAVFVTEDTVWCTDGVKAV